VEKLSQTINAPPEMLRSSYVTYSEIDSDQKVAMREIHRAFDDDQVSERYKYWCCLRDKCTGTLLEIACNSAGRFSNIGGHILFPI
jgi:hypothetical protein